MKKDYIAPLTHEAELRIEEHLLTPSEHVPIGGEGEFDTPQWLGMWEDDVTEYE